MCRSLFIVLVAAVLLGAVAHRAAGQGQELAADGDQVYVMHCARCHDDTQPRMPTRDALREQSARQIQSAMTSGVMRQFASRLSAAERRAVAEFLSDDPAGTLAPSVPVLPATAFCDADDSAQVDLSAPAWNGWGVDLANRRLQPTESAGLTADDVGGLRLRWAFGFPGVTATGSQATVVAGRVLVGTRNGLVYALDAATGCVRWVHEAPTSVRSAISVGPADEGGFNAYFGDGFASVHAVDLLTGELRWTTTVESHAAAQITGAPALHDGVLFVPVSSLEEVSAADPRYECCTFRGSVVALDAATGQRFWKRFVITESPQPTRRNGAGTQNLGPSGAGVWSAPTLDPARNQLYIATGDAYSDPAAAESDAIMALQMDTGEIHWVTQTTPGDAFTIACVSDNPVARANCPESNGPDVDYGSSPVLISGPGGEDLLLAGQKSGVMYGLRPETGEIVWETRVSDGGLLGGIEWGFAADDTQVYVSISDAMEKAPGEAGGVTALRIEDGELVWHAPPVQDTCGSRPGCHTAQPAAVTLIPGVAFAGSLDGHLRAHSTDTGRVIWDFDTAREFVTVNGVEARGGALNGPGPTIVDGMLYVVSGYDSFGYMPGNVLLAFAVD